MVERHIKERKEEKMKKAIKSFNHRNISLFLPVLQDLHGFILLGGLRRRAVVRRWLIVASRWLTVARGWLTVAHRGTRKFHQNRVFRSKSRKSMKIRGFARAGIHSYALCEFISLGWSMTANECIPSID
jgi:hypothetical protein